MWTLLEVRHFIFTEYDYVLLLRHPDTGFRELYKTSLRRSSAVRSSSERTYKQAWRNGLKFITTEK
jgi:hypothetical protein